MATQQEIHAAADTLVSAGERPTLTALRAALGGGSFSTLSEAMKSWPGRNKAPAEAGAHDAPEAIVQALTAIWTDAKVLAKKEHDGAMAEMLAFKADADREAKEALDLLEANMAELDVCKGERTALAAQNKQLDAELTAAKGAGDVANATLIEVRSSLALVQQALDQARAEIKEERHLARTAEANAAELRGRLAAASKQSSS